MTEVGLRAKSWNHRYQGDPGVWELDCGIGEVITGVEGGREKGRESGKRPREKVILSCSEVVLWRVLSLPSISTSTSTCTYYAAAEQPSTVFSLIPKS